MELTRSARILIVDDDTVTTMVMQHMLSSLGFTVVAAVNGEEAIELMSLGPFNAIITDCEMPVMDGYTLAATIRRSEAGSGGHLMILGYSASDSPDALVRCKEAGMDGLLVKPVSASELATALSSIGTCEPAGSRPLREAPVISGVVRNELLKSTRSDLVQIRRHLSEGATHEPYRLAHRIKGAAAIAGAAFLESACIRLENGILDTAPDQIDLALAEIEGALFELDSTRALHDE